MSNEKERIEQVFNNWYYDGVSVTNVRALRNDTKHHQFNEYIRWKMIVEVLIKSGLTRIGDYRILDAGCGNGNALRKIIELGAMPENCYGIDVSEKVIEYARSLSPQAVQYQVGFIDHMNYGPASFDLIFNFGVLIHILDNEHIREIGREFRRVIKDDGLLLVVVADETTKWPKAIAHTSRTFSFRTNELQDLFPSFRQIGVFDSHTDLYPPSMSLGLILQVLEAGVMPLPFKLVVFQPI